MAQTLAKAAVLAASPPDNILRLEFSLDLTFVFWVAAREILMRDINTKVINKVFILVYVNIFNFYNYKDRRKINLSKRSYRIGISDFSDY